MGFLPGFKNKNEVVLALSLGSDGASAALVEIKHDTVPHVIFSIKDNVSLAEEKKPEKAISTVLASLQNALRIITKEGLPLLASHRLGGSVKAVHCTLSSPWFVSETKVIRIKKLAPTLITEKLIQETIEQEKNIYIQSVTSGEYAKNFHEKLEVIESKVSSIKLNGYETNNPYGKMATDIEVSLYISIAGQDLVEKIKKVIDEHIHPRRFEMHTFPIVAYSTIRDLSSAPHSFLIFDITAEITDISVVKQSMLTQTVSIPVGKNFFVRKISKALNTVPQVALSFFKLYAEGRTEPSITAKLDGVFEKLTLEWQSLVHKSFSELSQESFIPLQMFLLCDTQLAPFFTKLVEDQHLSTMSTDNDTFTVTTLTSSELKNIYQIESNQHIDADLIAESLFIHKISNAKNLIV